MAKPLVSALTQEKILGDAKLLKASNISGAALAPFTMNADEVMAAGTVKTVAILYYLAGNWTGNKGAKKGNKEYFGFRMPSLG